MADWGIVGHAWAVELLARAVQSDRVSHAYLFLGPAQIGKTTLARAFAQVLVCEQASGPDGNGAPCGVCRACRRVSEGRYPDVQVITAEKNWIQIEQIRNLQIDAAVAPLEGKCKVFVIEEIERATPAAANALLKTLEEPPPHVVLVLTSNRRDMVLPTVLSRCQIIGLRGLPIDAIAAALQARWDVAEDLALLLARLSGGRLGWAVDAATDPSVWQTRSKYLDDLLTLTGEGHVGRLNYAEGLSRAGEDVETALGLWATWWRDVLLVQQGQAEALLNLDRKSQLAQQAALYPPEQVQAALTDLMQTLRRVRGNVNLRLALDVLLLRLPKPAVT
ncbi:MAG: DNA polymerase III subunit delta' [Nitrososphaerales archaeon]